MSGCQAGAWQSRIWDFKESFYLQSGKQSKANQPIVEIIRNHKKKKYSIQPWLGGSIG